MSARVPKRKTEHVKPDEAVRRHQVMDEAVLRFNVNLNELESALGLYVIGRHFGWKVLYLIHSKKTVRKYEEILGIDVREEFLDAGPDAERSNAFRALSSVTNYWKAVSGETAIADKKLVS